MTDLGYGSSSDRLARAVLDAMVAQCAVLEIDRPYEHLGFGDIIALTIGRCSYTYQVVKDNGATLTIQRQLESV